MEDIIRQAEAEDSLTRGRIKALRDKATKAGDASDYALLKAQAEELEKTLKPIPVPPRLIIEDVTTEHMATLLSIHKERLGIFSDESGPLDNWGGRYSSGVPNIDLPLKSHTGSPLPVDQGFRPSIMLYRPLLSIGLAPQPTVIGSLISNRKFRERGLPARFLFFLPTSLLGYRTLQARPVPDAISREYERRMGELAELEAAPDDDGGQKPRTLDAGAPGLAGLERLLPGD